MNLKNNADSSIFLKKRKGCFFADFLRIGLFVYRKASMFIKIFKLHGKWYHKNHFQYVNSYNTIVITALLGSLTAFLWFTEVLYNLNTFCSPSETSNFFIRLPLPFHNIKYMGNHAFFTVI